MSPVCCAMICCFVHSPPHFKTALGQADQVLRLDPRSSSDPAGCCPSQSGCVLLLCPSQSTHRFNVFRVFVGSPHAVSVYLLAWLLRVTGARQITGDNSCRVRGTINSITSTPLSISSATESDLGTNSNSERLSLCVSGVLTAC